MIKPCLLRACLLTAHRLNEVFPVVDECIARRAGTCAAPRC